MVEVVRMTDEALIEGYGVVVINHLKHNMGDSFRGVGQWLVSGHQWSSSAQQSMAA